jgi:hypothetical protein
VEDGQRDLLGEDRGRRGLGDAHRDVFPPSEQGASLPLSSVDPYTPLGDESFDLGSAVLREASAEEAIEPFRGGTVVDQMMRSRLSKRLTVFVSGGRISGPSRLRGAILEEVLSGSFHDPKDLETDAIPRGFPSGPARRPPEWYKGSSGAE